MANHSWRRRASRMAFSPKASSERAKEARALAIELIEGFKDRGHCEFVADFAHHLPVHIFLKTHRCPESLLARTEIRIFLEEWLPRIPDFEVTPGQRVVAQSGSVNGVISLPLSWQV